MKVIDAGHKYELATLDEPKQWWRWLWRRKPVLTFVKREGEKFPGNVGHYPGTTLQEVLRACIDRVKYVDGQIPDDGNNVIVLGCLRTAIYYLERRAYMRHGRREIDIACTAGIEDLPVNSHGHLWKE